MGLFSTILGIDATAGAFNAALTEHVWPQLEPEAMSETCVHLVSIICRGSRMTPERAVEFYDNSNRVQQLNVLALAIMDSGRAPSVRAKWMSIDNPFHPFLADPIIWAKVAFAEAELASKYHILVRVPREQLPLATLLARGLDAQPVEPPAGGVLIFNPEKDLLTDLAALESEYDDNMIDDQEYASRREEITIQRAEARVRAEYEGRIERLERAIEQLTRRAG